MTKTGIKYFLMVLGVVIPLPTYFIFGMGWHHVFDAKTVELLFIISMFPVLMMFIGGRLPVRVHVLVLFCVLLNVYFGIRQIHHYRYGGWQYATVEINKDGFFNGFIYKLTHGNESMTWEIPDGDFHPLDMLERFCASNQPIRWNEKDIDHCTPWRSQLNIYPEDQKTNAFMSHPVFYKEKMPE